MLLIMGIKLKTSHIQGKNYNFEQPPDHFHSYLLKVEILEASYKGIAVENHILNTKKVEECQDYIYHFTSNNNFCNCI